MPSASLQHLFGIGRQPNAHYACGLGNASVRMSLSTGNGGAKHFRTTCRASPAVEGQLRGAPAHAPCPAHGRHQLAGWPGCGSSARSRRTLTPADRPASVVCPLSLGRLCIAYTGTTAPRRHPPPSQRQRQPAPTGGGLGGAVPARRFNRAGGMADGGWGGGHGAVGSV